LFVVGILADMLTDNDLQIGVNADLGVVSVVKASALPHDPKNRS
jgi:hypothetical protein